MTVTAHTEQADLPTAETVAADIDWHGRSGELVTGAEVAQHLEAAIALLEKRGWSRTLTLDTSTSTSTDALAGADESWSIKRMLLALIHTILEDDQPVVRPLTMSEALHEVNRSQDGDLDSWTAATRCIEAVLRMRTGARFPELNAWSEKRSRTHEDIRDLLQEAADFARQHGPAV